MTQTLELNEDHRQIFSGLYARNAWGEGSGPGSTLEYTRGYRAFLEQFIAEHRIRSVLDVGCGDWQFSGAVDWKGARYVGLDIVPELIERNRAHFPGVEFVVGDGRQLEAYAGFDLVLIKDVLQHWSTKNVLAFLKQPAFASFKHVLLTNCDFDQRENQDIRDGDWRPLNFISRELASVGARVAFRFQSKRVAHIGPRLTAPDILERFEWWIVNLDRRPDRLAHATSQLARINVTNPHRFQAFDGSRLRLQSCRPDWVTKGAVGCYLSHLALLKQAQARRQPCVIVEDDLLLSDDFSEQLDLFLAAVPESWDVLLLSAGEHCQPPKILGPNHVRLVGTWGTTMAVLRLPAIDRLLQEADGLDRPIDDFYIRMMQELEFYAPSRKLVDQNWSLGTNVGERK
jgi:SAM-dependent methyltransferase